MARVQLALNVENVDDAVAFYSKMFDTQPHKRRDGYANFEVADPPLKLVLMEGLGEPGSLNHLGVEVDSTDAVAAADQRLRATGLETEVEEATLCCHAVQDKSWVSDPSGRAWEIYTILDDTPDDAGQCKPVPQAVAMGTTTGPAGAPCC